VSREGVPEELRIQGSQLVESVRDLIHQGNVRRLQIRHEGKTVLELPLTVAAVGVLVAPMLAALGAFAALATECTLVVQRVEGRSAGTAGDTWAELGPAATATTSPEEGTMGGTAGMEHGGMEVGGQDIAPGDPEGR
jgi:uncharacterized protein DUF4342